MDRVVEAAVTQGARLTCVRAERFKTGCLSMTFLAPHTKKTAALNAALPYVLRRGTARLTDMEAIAAALDDLYGARIEPAIRKRGEVTAVGFCGDFPDGAFLPERADILSGVAFLMGELILSPATRGGRLRADYVETERQNLMDDINAELNDKRGYAGRRLTEAMFRGESYGVSKLGTLADAQRVSVQTLTRHYRELIATAPLEVFYCGAEEPERVLRIVREALAALPRAGEFPRPETRIDFTEHTAPPKLTIEKMDVTQGRLIQGYRLGELMREPDYAALAVFNELFGGAGDSRLFMDLREERGLCYYVSSAIDRHKGVMFVSTGIPFHKLEEATGEIARQLRDLQEGHIGQVELEGARRAVTGAIYAALDEPGGQESLYLDRAILGMAPLPGELADLCAAVTAQDVERVARAVRLTHTFFLTGEDEDAEEA